MAAVAAAGCSLSVPSVNDDVESVTTTCASTYRVMAGCSAGWSVITDASRCAAVKAALVPAFSGVQEGGFGNEWANGTTAPLPVARLLPLCFICSTAGYYHLPLYPQPGFHACLMPSRRSGCFYNGNGVYFHTVGDQNAHSGDQTTYTANGGWRDTHQALCKLRTAGAAQPSRSSSSSSAGNPACWSGAYTAARCCDASLGASGDRTCWSGQFNFVFCCAMVPGGH